MQESGERWTMHEGLVLVACAWTSLGERTCRHRRVLGVAGRARIETIIGRMGKVGG